MEQSPPEPRDAALLTRIESLAREQARIGAELSASICEFIDLRRSEPVDGVAVTRGRVVPGEFAADEIAAELSWSTHRVQALARKYRRLASALPKTLALWRSGRIDDYKASKVIEAADRLSWPESVATLDDEAAERAVDETPTKLQRWLNRRVARLEPSQADRRFRRAHADRKVCGSTDLDGMGSLWMAAGAAESLLSMPALRALLAGSAPTIGAQSTSADQIWQSISCSAVTKVRRRRQRDRRWRSWCRSNRCSESTTRPASWPTDPRRSQHRSLRRSPRSPGRCSTGC